jgi:hypothetical protein
MSDIGGAAFSGGHRPKAVAEIDVEKGRITRLARMAPSGAA